MFLQIDNKILLKLYDVKIPNSKNYTEQIPNIHKIAFTVINILNIFQNITINSLYYGKTYIKRFEFKNRNLILNSDFLTFKAVLNPDIKHPFINFEYIKLQKPKLIFTDTVINFFFFKDKIRAEGKGKFNKNKFDINILLSKNNTLKINLNTKKINYNKSNIKNISLNSDVNLSSYTYDIKGKFDYADIFIENKTLNINKGAFETKNDKTTFTAENIRSPFKDIKNIYIENPNISYDMKNSFLIINSPLIKADYNDINISSYKNSLIYQNTKNLNFTSDEIIIAKNDYKTTLKHNTLNITNSDISYSIKEVKLDSKKIHLKSSPVTGNKTTAKTKRIEGITYGFDTLLQNIRADIKNKALFIKQAKLNHVLIDDIKYENSKITLHSNSLFDNNIKTLLHKFLNTDIPILQIGGKNEIISVIDLSNDIDSLTHIKTFVSLLKLFNFDLFIPAADINITNKNLNFVTQNAKLYLQKNSPLTFSGNGIIDYKKNSLVMSGKTSFKIDKIIDLKDFNETLKVDFDKNILTAKNSSLYIDFNKNQLIINPMQKIINFTTFKDFVKDGILLITFSKTTDIVTYFLLKLPILYEHTDTPINNLSQNLIEKTFLNIKIDKDIKIYNQNIRIDINDCNINANIDSLDINLFPLETLFSKNNLSTKDFNYTINLYTNNANLIYKKHKFLSRNATISYKYNNITFHSIYKNSSLEGYTKQNYFLLKGKHFTNEELKALLPAFNFFSAVNFDFVTVKSPEDFYTGKIYINYAVIKELKSLNNLIAFINTVPSALSLSSPGFSSKGYKIKNGYINYLLYKKILYIKQAKINGDNLDFYAKGYIDLNKNFIFLKIKANMKMRLKKISLIGKGLSYLLFGKDGDIDVRMIMKGDINNPTVKKDIGKDILLSPFKLFKRVVTLPFNLF